MIEILDLGDEGVLGLAVSGKVDEEDFRRVEAALDPRIGDGRRLNLYMEIRAFGGFTLQGLLRDLRFGLGRLRDFIGSVERVAVVADAGWIRAVAHLEYLLIPGVEERSFRLDERERALAWVGAAAGPGAPR